VFLQLTETDEETEIHKNAKPVLKLKCSQVNENIMLPAMGQRHKNNVIKFVTINLMFIAVYENWTNNPGNLVT